MVWKRFSLGEVKNSPNKVKNKVQIVQFATFLDVNWYVDYKVVWIINKFWKISKPGTVVIWSNKTRETTSCHACKQGHK